MADSTPSTLAVSILERDYRVNCPPESQQELLEAAQFLDKKMREIREIGNQTGKVLAADRIAVIAALNITRQMQQTERTQSTMRDDIKRLEDRLDDALQQDLQLEL